VDHAGNESGILAADKTVFGNRSCLYDDVRIEVIVDVIPPPL
jgi:hypothetical protein